MQPLDPGHLVALVQSSFAQIRAACHSKSGFVAKFVPIVQHLLGVENGRAQALELCLALKLEGTLLPKRRDRGLLEMKSDGNGALDTLMLVALGVECESPPFDADVPFKQDVDIAALKRRLCESMDRLGCQDLMEPGGHGWGFTDCLCQRRLCLEVQHYLQIAAYSQIRAKVYLTLGSLLPEELCFATFEYAMLAEEIPMEPRIPIADHKVSNGTFKRSRSFQYLFRDEYRCPKYRGLDRDGRTAKERAQVCAGGTTQA